VRLSVTGRHIEITDSMKQYAEDKARKLTKFYDRIGDIEVVVDRESAQFRVEMLIRTDHRHTFVGQVGAGDFYEAIDLVADKLERQLKKHKEKHRNRKHSTKSSPKMSEEQEIEGAG